MPAAPATEPTVVTKPTAQNLSVRQRAKQMTQARSERNAAASAPANQTPTPAAASIPPVVPPVSREETQVPADTAADPAPLPPDLAAPEPASAPNAEAPTHDNDNTDPNDPEAAPEDGAALAALLGDPAPDDGEATSARTEEAWLQQLDEALKNGDTPKAIKELQKRLHSVVDQRDTERNARLDAEKRLAERATEPEARPVEATGDHPALAQIDQTIAQTLSSIELMDAHLEAVRQAQVNGDEVPRNITLPNGEVWMDNRGKPIEVTPEQARKWSRQYELHLTQLHSRRETTLAQVETQQREAVRQSLSEASIAYPWMRNAKAPEYQQLKTLLLENPGLKSKSDWPLVASDYIAGRAARLSGQAKKVLAPKAPPMQRPKGDRTPPPVGAQPGAVRASGGEVSLQKQVQNARERYYKTGSVKDKASLLALQRQQQHAA